ncbi:Cytosine deaminase [Planococcus halocryophilus Or1]|uniref:Deaminase n=1 Tax=Planococcus halocryophilus TaxID=1215089 RepID=A0A1C7DT51_9BACL|nr:amidohydrolase [Planococcus halocryophilus]ANU14582.1 deaminase [Planococcus halocryophilus]EMF46756.1 Cytosine deaminase [Planococcus halocryophilus Or1]
MGTAVWIKNVLLEEGLSTSSNNSLETHTALYHLKIEGGKITEKKLATEPIETGIKTMDAKGLLGLPSFKEMHNHLDKTYLSLDWKACQPVSNLKQRLNLESIELEELSETVEQRATAMIQLLQSKGATHIRTHVNIDPYIGLKNLEGIRSVLEAHSDKLSYEIVAFPQHGLLNGDVPGLMKKAMRSGATMVGGLDPAGIDRNIEKSLDMMMNIATEFDADIDIHLHDSGQVGYYTTEKLIELTKQAQWQNRVAVSHAFNLGESPIAQQEKIAKELAEVGMAIMSTVPITKTMPPVALLDQQGVNVHFGCDGFYDSWSPYGSGDLLEKASLYSEVYRKSDERGLANSLKFITNGITPLSDTGDVVWPTVGDEADFVFVEASCSAEAVARTPERKAVVFRGKLVYGEL